MSPWSSKPQHPQQPRHLPPQTVSVKANTQTQPSSNIDYSIPSLLPPPPPPSERADNATLRHARSFSHPFPSFFGGGKKTEKKNAGKSDTNAGVDSTDDESAFMSKAIRLKRDISKPGEPKTGRCMTCDSTVRWPKDVKVFRCVTCQTVNDLEPYFEPQKEEVFQEKTGPEASIGRKPLPISVEKTRAMIDRCVIDHLKSLLYAPQTPPSQSKTPPYAGDRGDYFQHRGYTQNREPMPPPWNDNPMPQRSKTTTSPKKDRLPERPMPHGRPSPASMPRKPGFNPADRPHPAAQHQQGHGHAPNHSLSIPEVSTGMSSDRAESDMDTGVASHRPTGPPIFRNVEKYIQDCLTGCACLNRSFMAVRPRAATRAASESSVQRPVFDAEDRDLASDATISQLDPRMLLLGDIAENGSWWTGGRPERRPSHQRDRSPDPEGSSVSIKTPRINWSELAEWYHLIIHAGEDWHDKWRRLRPEREDSPETRRWRSINPADVEVDFHEARVHAQRQLLKAIENLLKRPRQPLKHPEDCRFLMILLANPLLFSPESTRQPVPSRSDRAPDRLQPNQQQKTHHQRSMSTNTSVRRGNLGHHAGLLKRIFGLIANLPDEAHHFIASWFSRFSESHFQRLVDLVGGFVTYRLTRLQNQKPLEALNPTAGLVPDFSGPGGASSAQVHAALANRPAQPQKPAEEKKLKLTVYAEDWQIRVAARVMALLFKANTWNPSRQRDLSPRLAKLQLSNSNSRHSPHNHGQIVPTSAFYNTKLDYCDLVADFQAWESSRSKFAFCRYPFFLSIWAKIHIMEFDAKRQMEVRAREAFFDSILTRKAVSQYLVLKVRRECLVEDSLQAVSEVIGSGSEDIKKGLKIDFHGEEGVDAGGLRKEWFLLLTREIFDPQHGLFVYDEDSSYCYFNPFCFESSEQFFLVGVLLGLAIYNSTILDVALPPFAFKKLLASAPLSITLNSAAPKVTHGYTLDDLAEVRPGLARGLRQLLEYPGNVEQTFALDFVVQVDRYGEPVAVPLCHGGEKKAVTNSNRKEFVDLYIRYLLDTAISRQYEPFKRGFFTVCGGNALSLFRPEEIELLIRGSDEPLDISALKAVATYENWHATKPDDEPQVQWFWEAFFEASPKDQRKVLSFITGSDRIPAMGATNLVLRITCLGQEDTNRLPTARTCFNMLALYRYSTREKLEQKLWMAISESEGFGLK